MGKMPANTYIQTIFAEALKDHISRKTPKSQRYSDYRMKQTWQECLPMTLGRPVQIGWPKQKVTHKNTLNESKAIFGGEINHKG